jgi:hypothetical protein
MKNDAFKHFNLSSKEYVIVGVRIILQISQSKRKHFQNLLSSGTVCPITKGRV